MYMDDIKLFTENEKVKIYSQEKEMEFGIEKFAKLILKRGKRHMTDRMELPNQ